MVGIKSPTVIKSFDKETLKVEIDGYMTTLPRFISALGQFLPGYNWQMPPRDATYEEDFYVTGRYYLEDRLYISRQKSDIELDQDLDDLVEEMLDGTVFYGKVVGIYATYINSTETKDDEVEFYDDTSQASHDHYAYEVYVIIQDLGTYAEYSVNAKYVQKMGDV